MDRFIGLLALEKFVQYNSLKSNMDRFIDVYSCHETTPSDTLKSNMDRFIDAVLIQADML